MISRQTCLAIADLYDEVFRVSVLPGDPAGRDDRFVTSDTDKLYDFLYGLDYDAWFCNLIRSAKAPLSTRPLRDFLLKLHTGESLASASTSWSWEERQKLGQRYLIDLSQDILANWRSHAHPYFQDETSQLADVLLRQLELDGYLFQDGKLLAPERDVINVEEEVSLLRGLFTSLGLPDPATAFHHLDQSEARYIEGNWDDSISNSRKYLECVIQAVAIAHHLRAKGRPIADTTREKPVLCRDYLHAEGLIEKKELDALGKIYALLSHTGGHPYMAQQDQARLMRHLALTFSQFVLLRYRGYLKGA